MSQSLFLITRSSSILASLEKKSAKISAITCPFRSRGTEAVWKKPKAKQKVNISSKQSSLTMTFRWESLKLRPIFLLAWCHRRSRLPRTVGQRWFYVPNDKKCNEQFSFESKGYWSCINYDTRLAKKKIPPLFHPVKRKTDQKHSLALVFPRFTSSTCDWLEWLDWFKFYDTPLKTVL